MHFIDINCMIGEWPFEDLRFKSAQALCNEMNRLGIVKSLVFHSRSWLYNPVKGNESIIVDTEESDSLIPVMVLTPLIKEEFGGKENIYRFIRNNKIGAVRLFPIDHNYTLEHWNVESLFSVVNEIHMPVMIDMRNVEGELDCYSRFYELAKKFAAVPIILLTVGYRNTRIIYRLFEKCPNIYIDTSTFINFRGIEDVVKYFGSERILFGTRMPFIEGGVSVGRLIYADISQKDKENIAYGNILKLLKDANCCTAMKGEDEA